MDGVIGNSSSGLLEVPYFRKGTINIGERQKGRLKTKSIIDCNPESDSITKAIKKVTGGVKKVVSGVAKGVKKAVKGVTKINKELLKVSDIMSI